MSIVKSWIVTRGAKTTVQWTSGKIWWSSTNNKEHSNKNDRGKSAFNRTPPWL